MHGRRSRQNPGCAWLTVAVVATWMRWPASPARGRVGPWQVPSVATAAAGALAQQLPFAAPPPLA